MWPAAIILLGALLRLLSLKAHTFWFDEAWSFFVARLPFPTFLKTVSVDTNPPFYFLLLKGWLLISQEVFSLRFLSLIFGVAALPITYWVFKRLTDAKNTLLATTLLAFSPLHIYYSVETRMYSLLVLEILVLSFLFLKFLKEKKTSSLALLTLVSLLALYTHYYAALFILSLNFWFFLNLKKYRPLLKPWLISQVTVSLLFAPWFFFILQSPKTPCWCFHPVIGLPAAFASFTAGGMGVVTLKEIGFYGPRLPLVLFSISSLLSLLAFFKGILVAKKKNLTLLVFFLAPLILASISGLFLPLFSPRSLIIIAPFYYLLVSLGLSSIRKSPVRNLFVITLLGLFLATVLIQILDPFFFGPPIKKAAEFVAQKYQEEEAILHVSPISLYPFIYFHQEAYPEYFLPRKPLAAIFEIGEYQKTTSEIAGQYKGVWLVNLAPKPTNQQAEEIKKTLLKSFTLESKKNYNKIEIYHYAR